MTRRKTRMRWSAGRRKNGGEKGANERITIGKNYHQLATPRNRKDEERLSQT